MKRLLASIVAAGLAAELVHMLAMPVAWAPKWLVMAPLAFFLTILLMAVCFPEAGESGFWRSNPYGTRFGLPNLAHPAAKLVYGVWAIMALAWLAACYDVLA